MSDQTKRWPDSVMQIAFTPISQNPAAVSFAGGMANWPAFSFASSTSPSWYRTASSLTAVSSVSTSAARRRKCALALSSLRRKLRVEFGGRRYGVLHGWPSRFGLRGAQGDTVV